MSASRNLMDRLSDARPRRLDPDYRPDPAAIVAWPPAHRTPPASRPGRRRLLIGLVPTAAVVLAGAVVLATGGPGAQHREPGAAGQPPSAAGTAPATARDLFLVAATQISTARDASGRYWVLDAEMGEAVQVGPAARTYRVMRRNQVQQWLPARAGDRAQLYSRSLGAAPVSAADRAAWQADGSPTRWKQPAPDGRPATVIDAAPDAALRGPRTIPSGALFLFAGDHLSMADLAKLPGDAAALRRWVTTRHTGDDGRKVDDYTLFILGSQLVFDLPVPPAVRAAAYQMLAEVHGVRSLGPVTDQRGRRGVAVGYTRRGDGGWAQNRLIVDPGTGHALAEESWFFGSGAAPATQGTLMGYQLVLSAAYSDQNPPA